MKDLAMNEHYVVTLDRGHLRIYAEQQDAGQTPRLEIVEAMDFPQGKHSYTDRQSDQAGRFPGSQGRSGGMSIDERLPMKREEERRSVGLLAGELETFLQSRPGATWDFAAAPELSNAVIEGLSLETRRRLKRALPKDLVNQTSEDVRAHFAGAVAAGWR